MIWLCSNPASAQQIAGTPAAGWMHLTLATSQRDSFDLSALQKYKASVLLFLDPECPVSQKYGATIRQLYQEAKEQQVAVVAIYPVPGLLPETVRQFAEDYQYAFPQLLDDQQQLVRALQASTTPEAFLVDPQGQVIYHGAIDNWFYSLGRYRKVVTQHYLQEAVTAFLTGKPVRIEKATPVGCLIGNAGMGESHHHQH